MAWRKPERFCRETNTNNSGWKRSVRVLSHPNTSRQLLVKVLNTALIKAPGHVYKKAEKNVLSGHFELFYYG